MEFLLGAYMLVLNQSKSELDRCHIKDLTLQFARSYSQGALRCS
jgi:hypothetical protein